MPPTSIDGSEITGATIDGQDVSEITVDGQTVFTAIPDSVVHQYPVSTFGTSWTDDVGGADMSVNGLTSSTFSNGEESVSSDGTDDSGTAASPETLPQNKTFGLAFTIEASSIGSGTYMGFENFGAPRFRVVSTSFFGDPQGNFVLELRDDNGNGIDVATSNDYDDGTPHAVIINKNGNTASDVNIYVDDMSSPVAADDETDGGFDHTAFTPSLDFAFYAGNEGGSIKNYLPYDAGVFEFNTAAYSQSEREDFVNRRPEV